MDALRSQEIPPGWSLTTAKALELPELLILVEVQAFPQQGQHPHPHFYKSPPPSMEGLSGEG